MVDRSIDGPFFRLGVSLRFGDPRDDTTGQGLNFCGHASNFLKRSIISEPTSLQPKSREGKLSFFSSVLAERRNQLEFIYSYLHDTGIPLPECIEEGLRMEQFAKVDSILQKRLSLCTLDPLDKSRSLFVGNTNPSCGVLGAFPLFLPGSRDCVSHQLSSFSLSLGSEHFGSLENLSNGGDTLINSAEELDSTLHFHINELLNGVIGFSPGDMNIIESLISLVDIRPQLADRTQSFGPFLFVKADFRGTYRSKTLQLRDNLSTVETLDGSVDVAGQAEDLGVINLRELRDGLNESTRIFALSDLNDSSERLLSLHNFVSEDFLHVRAQDTHIELIINTSSIDSVLKETKDLLPGWGLSPLGIDKATEDLLSSL